MRPIILNCYYFWHCVVLESYCGLIKPDFYYFDRSQIYICCVQAIIFIGSAIKNTSNSSKILKYISVFKYMDYETQFGFHSNTYDNNYIYKFIDLKYSQRGILLHLVIYYSSNLVHTSKSCFNIFLKIRC